MSTPVALTQSCWLDRRHPQHAVLSAHWHFVQQSYDGGPAWFTQTNLPKYPSEHPDKYKHRLANATRDNYTAEVVDQHTGYLFKSKPVRTSTVPQLVEFWGKAMRSDGDMDDLMADVTTETGQCRYAAVIVDKPAVIAGTAADDRLPYAYVVKALDLLDYTRDEDGELLEVLTRECTRSPGSLMDPDSGKPLEQYRLRTRFGWSLWQKDDNGNAVEVASGTWRVDGSDLGAVPVVIVEHKGLVDEIARIDRLIAQEQTSLHEVIEWLGAPTLTFPGEIDDPVTLGVAGVIPYTHDAANPPSYLTPDAAFLGTLQERIDKLIDKVRELASLPTRAGGGANQSGESKKWDAQPLQARLSDKAATLQAAEMAVVRIVGLFLGADVSDATVQYPTTFDVTTLADDLANAASLDEFPGQSSPTFRVRLAQSIARKALPDLSEKDRQTIDREIAANISAGDTAPEDDGDGMDPDDQQDDGEDAAA